MRTNVMIKRTTLIVFTVLAILICLGSKWARPNDAVTYPSGYRKWVHVSSALVNPTSATAGRYGGLHHIYANERAMEGYRTGQFADGSVIVFDLLQTRESAGTTMEGPRRFIDVMTKDSRRYGETGGWDFEEFTGDNQKDPVLTAQAKRECYSCHARQRNHDFVFSTFRT